MKLATGLFIGLVYVYITYVAYRRSAAGWDAGHSDLGFWWAVIAGFLGIAALAAMIGTWLHVRSPRR